VETNISHNGHKCVTNHGFMCTHYNEHNIKNEYHKVNPMCTHIEGYLKIEGRANPSHVRSSMEKTLKRYSKGWEKWTNCKPNTRP
jgi:hypothetical protein